jgi:hypothetical protein
MDFAKALENERSQRQVEIADVLQQLEQERSQRKVELGLVRVDIQECQSQLTKLSSQEFATSDQVVRAVSSMARCYELAQQSVQEESEKRREEIAYACQNVTENLKQAASQLRSELLSLSNDLRAVQSNASMQIQSEVQTLRRLVALEEAEALQMKEAHQLPFEEQSLSAMIDCKQAAVWHEIESLGEYALLSEANQAEMQRELDQSRTQQVQFGKMLDVEMSMVGSKIVERSEEMHSYCTTLSHQVADMSQKFSLLAQRSPIRSQSAMTPGTSPLRGSSAQVGTIIGSPQARRIASPLPRRISPAVVNVAPVISAAPLVSPHGAAKVKPEPRKSEDTSAVEADSSELISRLNALRESMSMAEAREAAPAPRFA